ncbi:DUF7260 family protein [Halopiger thermotolerans]
MPPTPTPDRDRGRNGRSRASSDPLEAPAVSEIREPLATAREPLERERRQLTAERRAFERFRRRVAALETATPQATAATAGAGIGGGIGADTGGVGAGAAHAGAAARGRPSEGLSPVRDAYVKTVMSVPHYDDLYGDTWLESVAEEFSEEQAAALEQHARLRPQLQRSLVTAAAQAVENRAQLLEHVEAERKALADADRELTDGCQNLQSLLDQPLANMEFNALGMTRDRLESLRERCDELATERQTALRRRRRELVIGDVGTLERYFYGNCEHTYPILAAIAELGRGIERGTDAVDRSLKRLLERDSGADPVDRPEP